MALIVGGLAVGLLYGIIGVGSAFAAPMLAVIGIPGMAVGRPAAGAASGIRRRRMVVLPRQNKVDWALARNAVLGAFPAAIVGAACSHSVGGPVLLASGVACWSASPYGSSSGRSPR